MPKHSVPVRHLDVQVSTAELHEVLTFVDRHRLAGRGIAWLDAHLLCVGRRNPGHPPIPEKVSSILIKEVNSPDAVLYRRCGRGRVLLEFYAIIRISQSKGQLNLLGRDILGTDVLALLAPP